MGQSRSPGRPVTVGWLLMRELASVLFHPPEKLAWPGSPRPSKRGGATRCPAIQDLARQFWVIRSPFRLHLEVTRLEPGQAFFYRSVPEGGGVPSGAGHVASTRALSHFLKVFPPAEWDHPERPTLLLRLPYLFLSDRSVVLEQLPPFLSETQARFPGLVYGGRFPIDLWPRAVNFSFQWTDPGRPIRIERGDPLFYLRLLPEGRDQKVRLIEAERTPEVEAFVEAVSGVTLYTDRTFSLFERAGQLRPPRLVKARRRYLEPTAPPDPTPDPAGGG